MIFNPSVSGGKQEAPVYLITNEFGAGVSPPSSATAGEIVTFSAVNTAFSIVSDSVVNIPFESEGSFGSREITFVMPAENVTITG